MAYYISYYNDTLADGVSLTFPDDGVHRIFYVHRGNATIDGKTLPEDEAVYRRGASTVTGSDGGARVFRWELGTFAGKVPANIESMLRMTRECWTIAIAGGSEWLFRLDSIGISLPSRLIATPIQDPGFARCFRANSSFGRRRRTGAAPIPAIRGGKPEPKL